LDKRSVGCSVVKAHRKKWEDREKCKHPAKKSFQKKGAAKSETGINGEKRGSKKETTRGGHPDQPLFGPNQSLKAEAQKGCREKSRQPKELNDGGQPKGKTGATPGDPTKKKKSSPGGRSIGLPADTQCTQTGKNGERSERDRNHQVTTKAERLHSAGNKGPGIRTSKIKQQPE